MLIRRVRRRPLCCFYVAQVVGNRGIDGFGGYFRLVFLFFRLLDSAGENPRLEVPSVQRLPRCSPTRFLLPLSVLAPIEVEGAALGVGGFPADDDKARVWFSILAPANGHELPFAVNSSILFEVDRMAVLASHTIHAPLPVAFAGADQRTILADMDSSMDSK